MSITAQNVIDRFRIITGDIGGFNWFDADLCRWIYDAIVDLTRQSEHLEVPVTVPSVSGTSTYGTVTPFFKIKAVAFDGFDVDPIMRVDLDQMYPDRLVTPTVYTGRPKYFFVNTELSSITLFPTPDISGKDIHLIVVGRPSPVTTGTDTLTVPDEWMETIVTHCLQNAKEWDDEFAGAGYFAAKKKQQIADNSYDQQMAQTESYPSVRGVPGDNW